MLHHRPPASLVALAAAGVHGAQDTRGGSPGTAKPLERQEPDGLGLTAGEGDAADGMAEPLADASAEGAALTDALGDAGTDATGVGEGFAVRNP
ncbi:MAG TPA: hypothetical protein VFR93_05010, partial [Candidatus Limnocylindrales bacterium]|nr:hypothetical protein [Candidatus Limnocylindrales bacterium]